MDIDERHGYWWAEFEGEHHQPVYVGFDGRIHRFMVGGSQSIDGWKLIERIEEPPTDGGSHDG